MLNRLGIGMGTSEESLELKTSAKAKAQVDEILHSLGFEKKANSPLVGFALSASQQWLSKNWSVEYFIELAKAILDKYPARIFLIGSEWETPKAEAFRAVFSRDQVIDLVGKTSLANLIEVVRRLDVLIGGDSAPLHIAAAFKVPLVGFFGPTDHRRHEPPGRNKKIIQKKVSCGPCYEKRCSITTHDCMKLITPQEVFEAAQEYLNLSLPGRVAVGQSIHERERTASLRSE